MAAHAKRSGLGLRGRKSMAGYSQEGHKDLDMTSDIACMHSSATLLNGIHQSYVMTMLITLLNLYHALQIQM